MIPTPRHAKQNLKSLTLGQVAKLIGGELVRGNEQALVVGVSGLSEAKSGEISVLSDLKYAPLLETTAASAVVVSSGVVSKKVPLICVDHPGIAFNKIVSFFTKDLFVKSLGIHPSAVVDKTAQLGQSVSIGPHVTIEGNVTIGTGSVIQANCFIGSGSFLGENTLIYPNVIIRELTSIGNGVIIHSGTVIGSDGFGYETVEGVHHKIPQIGTVCIEDDVEIGANVCIDRGRFQKTWIQKGVKIDNLVQIAHNVVIGTNSLIVSQTGISGSSRVGKNVTIAGQVGIVGHVTIGDRAVIAAGAGVTKSIPDDLKVVGSPARPFLEFSKTIAILKKLPEIYKEFLSIKKMLHKSKK